MYHKHINLNWQLIEQMEQYFTVLERALIFFYFKSYQVLEFQGTCDKYYNRVFKGKLDNINSVYLEKDDHWTVDFNGETITLTFQLMES